MESLLYLSKNSNDGYAQYNFGNKEAIAVFSPEIIEDIFINKQKYFSRGPTFQKLKPFFGNGLFVSEDPEHLKNKRILQESFHKKNINNLLEHIYSIIFKNISGVGDKEISLTEFLDDLTFSIVSEVLLGKRFPKEFIKTYHEVSKMSSNLPQNYFSEDEMHNYIEMKKFIAAFVESNIDEKNIVGIMKNSGMENKQIVDEVITALGAGFETTSALIAWSLIHIHSNEEIKNNLLANLPEWANQLRVPEFSEVYCSDILNSIIKETLRTNPPVYFTTRTVKDDVWLKDIEFKAGTNIFISQYVCHRNEKYYEFPDSWIPERWTEDFEKNLPKGSYFPFGHGSKKCIGENLALTIATITVAIFVKMLDYTLTDGFPNAKYLVSMIPDGPVTTITRKK